MSDIKQLEQLGESTGSTRRVDGVVIGSLVGFAEEGVPLVDFPSNPLDNPLLARTIVMLSREDIGRSIALLFEGANPAKPIVIGPIVDPRPQMDRSVSIERDSERVEFKADREIILRCGSASITLTRAGKVLIRGAYVSSHSSGVNTIKGGAVRIN